MVKNKSLGILGAAGQHGGYWGSGQGGHGEGGERTVTLGAWDQPASQSGKGAAWVQQWGVTELRSSDGKEPRRVAVEWEAGGPGMPRCAWSRGGHEGFP